MKVRNSLRSLKQRDKDCRVVRRKGRRPEQRGPARVRADDPVGVLPQAQHGLEITFLEALVEGPVGVQQGREVGLHDPIMGQTTQVGAPDVRSSGHATDVE